jgi:hypothetical protein
LKESEECGTYQQVLAKAINGVGGVRNERHLKVGMMGYNKRVLKMWFHYFQVRLLRKNKWK